MDAAGDATYVFEDDGEDILPKGDGYFYPKGWGPCFINEKPDGQLEVVVFSNLTGMYRIHKYTRSQIEAEGILRYAYMQYNNVKGFEEPLPGTIH